MLLCAAELPEPEQPILPFYGINQFGNLGNKQ
jgi:hypothetical protein